MKPTEQTAIQKQSLIIATLIAVLVVVAAMFVPVVIISAYMVSPTSLSSSPDELETGVGIAVIVRATARRMFRSSAQSFLRTTLGAFSRTAARTVTRRITRIALRQLTGLTFATLVRSNTGEERANYSTRDSFIALCIGFIGLFASFRGILALLGTERASAVCGSMTLEAAAIIAATPILIHGAFTYLFTQRAGIRATFHTQLDGLLLQGYFVGAGSFLPLTTDTKYHGGTTSSRATAAGGALLSLVALHFVLNLIGRYTGSYPFLFASAAVLMYAFVFTFPLPPLEGNHLWRRSKWLWAAVWLPTLVAFIMNVPDAFAEIL